MTFKTWIELPVEVEVTFFGGEVDTMEVNLINSNDKTVGCFDILKLLDKKQMKELEEKTIEKAEEFARDNI